MDKGQKRLLIIGGSLIAIYVFYKIVTRPSNAKFFTNTNSKSTIPKSSDSPITDVAFNNVNKAAYTNKDNVYIYREPREGGILGIGFLNYIDHTVDASGTFVGNTTGVFQDEGGSGNQMYSLSTKSDSFLHKGDTLYVDSNDVTIS